MELNRTEMIYSNLSSLFTPSCYFPDACVSIDIHAHTYYSDQMSANISNDKH